MWAEILTLAGLIGMGIASMFLLPEAAKEIVMVIIPGLLGYLTRGVVDKVKETVVKVPEVKTSGET